MEFELLDANQVGSITVNEDNTQTMHVNVRVGVVGMPADEKYRAFKPEFTIQYTYSEALTVAQAKEGMQTAAAAWVAENYPAVV